ncbi:TRAP transporter small permease [Pseudaestuariivita sp.]|uniref:TRAP transporter small permease n=1 Tax=Pseudaestuariivita sp. TaxID=2211669 RepID=UPI004057CDBF
MSDLEGQTETAIRAEEVSLRQPSVWHLIGVLPGWIAGLFLFALMAMTFLDVVLRSALDNPIESATELTRLFMAIIVFASLPMVSWKGTHIAVDLLDPLFTRALARWRDALIDLVCGAALLWPAKRVFDLAERARSFGDETEYLGFPQYIPGWFIAAFTAITALVFLARGLVRIFAPHRLTPKGSHDD